MFKAIILQMKTIIKKMEFSNMWTMFDGDDDDDISEGTQFLRLKFHVIIDETHFPTYILPLAH